MKCPRCGGNMLGGVCEECGFPITAKTNRKYKMVYRRR